MPQQDIPKVTVDIWSDIVCPWCAIGYAQFAKALKQLDGEIEVEVRWMPFELNSEMAPKGELQSEVLARNYGSTAEQVSQMRQKMEEAGKKAGFSMAYEGPGDPPPAMSWNTFEAHKLLRWALSVEGMEAQTALKLALFRAHFQQRRQIGKREVLLDIAENLGFDRKAAEVAMDDEALGIAVRLEERRGVESKITSVPSFIFNGKYLVPGSQEPDVFRETMRKVVELAQAEAAAVS